MGLSITGHILPYSTKKIILHRRTDVPRSVPCPALLVRVLLADRRMLTGTSQPNARGTLLPPSPPEPQRGHTRTRKSLASQLASTAELPLKITAELHPTPHKIIRQPQFGSVTLRSPIIPFILPFPVFYSQNETHLPS
jgi:hypothetical protein